MKIGNAEVYFRQTPLIGSEVLVMHHKGLKGVARQEMQVAALKALIEFQKTLRTGSCTVKFFPLDKIEQELAEWIGFSRVKSSALHGMTMKVDSGWSSAAQVIVPEIERRMT